LGTVVEETLTPQADGMAITTEFGSDAAVGGLVGGGGTEEEATAEGQCLRSGGGPGEAFPLQAVGVG